MKIRKFGFLALLLLYFFSTTVYAASGDLTAGGDLSDWLYHISTQIPALIKLLVAVAYVSGFGFIVGAIMKVRRVAQSQTMMSMQESIAGPLIHIMVGVVLIYFASFVRVGSETLFGADAAIAYQSSVTDSDMFGGFLGPIILLMRFIGYIAFIKGLFLLGKMGGHQSQPGNLAKGLIHIMGGILAINIEATYFVLLHTLQGPNI